MNRPRTAAALALTVLAVSLAFASSAFATPGKSQPCTNCHSGSNVAISTSVASTSGSTVTYNVSAPTADAIAVFNGGTKIARIDNSSGQFSVAAGTTYDVYAVAGPNENDGVGHTTVSPVVAPPADTAPPTTTSNAAASYVSMAAITLSATDGGSGVAATYYRLDGGPQTAGTSVAVSSLGSHTLQFWSVDVAGNAETPKTVTFSVNAPAPAPTDTTPPVTTSNAVATYVGSATIALSATDGGSGVATTYYRLNGGAQTAGTSVAVNTAGTHTLEFWSVDVLGNSEAHQTVTFVVNAAAAADTTAPTTVSNVLASYVGTATITLSATDAGSGVAATYYELDSEEETAGTSIVVSAVGTHTIEYWSVDVAGNVEDKHEATFVVGAPAKVASALSIRSSGYKVKRNRTVTLSGSLNPASGTEKVVLYVKRPGAKQWSRLSTRSTTALGTSGKASWSYKYKLTKKGTYQFQSRFAGDGDSLKVTSKTIKVSVR